MKDLLNTNVEQHAEWENRFTNPRTENIQEKNSEEMPFPAIWLKTRIQQLIRNDDAITWEADLLKPFPHLSALISGYDLNEEESQVVLLVLAASVLPETLFDLYTATKDAYLAGLIGGVNGRGTSLFAPTLRTAIFLLAGNDAKLRAHYQLTFHPRSKLFTTGLIQTLAQGPDSLFADHQLVFNDQFLPTALQGSEPRLDNDPTFPVRKSKAKHLLDDVILKDKARNQLEKLRLFAKHQRTLWQINPQGKIRDNFICIFSGDPGTGKSHAAEALGNEFGLPVYKVNFAQMVSKYIGETEKNLEKVFDRFDKQGAILFFDEAEAIFSKRTEVEDAHDQHANNLQSYLLQKVEEFSGIIILATNVHDLSQYFDRAFQRRFRLTVQFEFPDYPERLRIWNQALFAPYAFEAGLTEKLAQNYQLSGGSIYNVVSDAILQALEHNTHQLTFELMEGALADEFKKTARKFESCTDEMANANPIKRFGVGYEQRRNF